MNLVSRIALGLALVAGAASTAAAQEAVVGQPAPDFTLVDEAGQSHTLSDYRGSTVVLEWTNPGCPFVVRHYEADTMEALASDHPDVIWLAVNSSHFNTADDSAAWKTAQGFAYPTLLDTDGSVGHLYGARTTPHMYVIDAEGTLAYAGAIDDDPRGRNDDDTNYVAAAIDALAAGQAPAVSSTDPYGCTVKYEGVD